MQGTCKVLEWDTQFFGVRIASVVGHRLDRASASAALEWCQQERIECLYFLADAADDETIATAEEHGFGMKDVRLTYTRRLEPSLKESSPAEPAGGRIRPSQPDDSPVLERIADGSFIDSRFYFDRRFPRPAVTEMYKVWIRQSVQGQADEVLVLEHDGRPSGFITCHLLGDRQGQCRLGGLDPALRGRGLGLQMYDAALRWFARADVETVIYVTQARNIRAQRLFQRLGFQSQSTQIWYHKWFDEVSP
jgi:dTDP-4-amino-4,6-dideoxy-D-galactose acyltransferase